MNAVSVFVSREFFIIWLVDREDQPVKTNIGPVIKDEVLISLVSCKGFRERPSLFDARHA
jgi:hypothetical protein